MKTFLIVLLTITSVVSKADQRNCKILWNLSPTVAINLDLRIKVAEFVTVKDAEEVISIEKNQHWDWEEDIILTKQKVRISRIVFPKNITLSMAPNFKSANISEVNTNLTLETGPLEVYHENYYVPIGDRDRVVFDKSCFE
jgi:hypothetical protein